ncbi:2252_t:CDS:2 [Diversispora eburnea]|uniref:ubiquitinyl hydrolase 1 n=1 Tax=Diversispora eburnea TaxID=1213867 RepID=A0A9N9AZF8_9GLOM|nr:2252_t:CDS:2 [Diversispora eburnea]
MINDIGSTEEKGENEEKIETKEKSLKFTRRLKEFLFIGSKKSSEEKKSSEKQQFKDSQIDYESKVDQLRTYLEELGHPLETTQIEVLLETNDWNVAEVAEYCKDLCEAEEGLIADLQKNDVMIGAENDQNTSCYIDSLLFAMFARTQSFDGMLFAQPENTKVRDLQTHLRLFVNRLRMGKFMSAYMIKQLREQLLNCGWIGKNDAGHTTQEDVSELFLFLSCLYELPYLPLGMHLFHGGNKDPNDERVVTERLIQVAIPGDPHDEKPVSLEEALMNYFQDNIVSGIKRYLTDDINHKTEVSAWQVLKLLPFYSAGNEQGENIKASESHFPTKNLMLQLVLKRYGFNDKLQPFRIKKNVYIPPYVNFNPFVNPEAEDEQPCHCGIDVHYRLKLRSVVCHYGKTLNCGHYKGYVLDDVQGWFRLDDLNVLERVKRFDNLQDVTLLFNNFSQNAYLLFYELQRMHPGVIEDELAIEYDYNVAQNLQFVEFSHDKGNCFLQ